MDLKKLTEQIAADNQKSDILNANTGTNGTNPTYNKAQGNRGKQLNPNQRPNDRAPGLQDDEDLDGEMYGQLDGAD